MHSRLQPPEVAELQFNPKSVGSQIKHLFNIPAQTMSGYLNASEIDLAGTPQARFTVYH